MSEDRAEGLEERVARFLALKVKGHMDADAPLWINDTQSEHPVWSFYVEQAREVIALAQRDQATPGVEGDEPTDGEFFNAVVDWLQSREVIDRQDAQDGLTVADVISALEAHENGIAQAAAPALPTTIRGGREEIARIIDPLPFDDSPTGWVGMPTTRAIRRDAALAKADAILALPASIGVGKEGLGADLSKPNRPGVDDSFASPSTEKETPMSTPDWRGYINIGQPDLADVVRAAYDPSRPQGLGFLHHREGGLSDGEVLAITSRERSHGTMPIVASMDYVNGRSVKMTVHKDPATGDLYVQHSWYDHSRGQLEQFLATFGIPASAIDVALQERDALNAEYEAAQDQLALAGAARLSAGPLKDDYSDELYAALSKGLARRRDGLIELVPVA